MKALPCLTPARKQDETGHTYSKSRFLGSVVPEKLLYYTRAWFTLSTALEVISPTFPRGNSLN